MKRSQVDKIETGEMISRKKSAVEVGLRVTYGIFEVKYLKNKVRKTQLL